MGVTVDNTVQRDEFIDEMRAFYAGFTNKPAADLKDFFVVGSAASQRRNHRWWLAAKSDWMNAPEFARLFLMTNCDPANPGAGVIENWSHEEVMAFYEWAHVLPGWSNGKNSPVILLPARADMDS